MKILAKNPRATFDFDIKRRILAGIVLAGHEVKSARSGNAKLRGSFATFKDNELWLTNAHIGAYKYANLQNYDPTASRKLLVTKREIDELHKAKQNGLHIVPTCIGISGRFVKVELGIGPSKKRRDKRQAIRSSDTNRDTARNLKNQVRR